MKKILYTVVSLVLLVFLLFFPRESLASAQEGMQLWLNILLPTLLPFMILTGVLIRTDMIGQRLTPMESIWQKIFGVSPAGAYAIVFGLLCGYPMGAKLTSDLYTSRKISRREAQYLLTFTNHASPMFISSYLIHKRAGLCFRGILASSRLRLPHHAVHAPVVFSYRQPVHCWLLPDIHIKKRDIL